MFIYFIKAILLIKNLNHSYFKWSRSIVERKKFEKTNRKNLLYHDKLTPKTVQGEK